MDNFDLTKFLAEGKLHEAELRPLSDEQLESVALMIADEFTADDIDGLDLQYVITPNSLSNSTPRGGGFDLDVERGPNTPGDGWKDDRGFDISNYLGAYAGGSYVIRPNPDKSDEYLVTNAAMRNAKVARVYFEGDTLKLKMFPEDKSIPMSSDEVEAQRKKEREMANVFVRENKNEDALLNIIMKYVKDPSEAEEELEKYQDQGFQGFSDPLAANLERDDEWKNLTEEKKSNKMKKSELKEMIKAAMLNEASQFQGIGAGISANKDKDRARALNIAFLADDGKRGVSATTALEIKKNYQVLDKALVKMVDLLVEAYEQCEEFYTPNSDVMKAMQAELDMFEALMDGIDMSALPQVYKTL